MATMKECPLCGGTMKMQETKSTPATPGGAAVRTIREWVCPDCDHFEEAGEDD